MPVFKVERTRDYTVMSNQHLRNKDISLKAKGLLSQMLSLPPDWDYTLAGLSKINREKIDAIRQAVKELERAGYIVRTRERDEKGRLRGADYIIYEQPHLDTEQAAPPALEKPMLENPTLEKPTLDNPTLGKPTLENPTQLNKDILNKDLINDRYIERDKERDRKNNSPSVDELKVINAWNELPQLTEIDPDAALTTKRRSNIQQLIKAHGVDKVCEIIAGIAKSDFLLGKNERSWRCTFDWVIKPDNFVKVLEGNYENTAPRSRKSTYDINQIQQDAKDKIPEFSI